MKIFKKLHVSIDSLTNFLINSLAFQIFSNLFQNLKKLWKSGKIYNITFKKLQVSIDFSAKILINSLVSQNNIQMHISKFLT